MKSKNFTVNVLRNSPFWIFSRNEIGFSINKCHKYIRKKIHIDGDGNQWRPFISVNDISKIYKLIIIKIINHIYATVSFNLKIKDLASKFVSLSVTNKIIFFNKKC